VLLLVGVDEGSQGVEKPGQRMLLVSTDFIEKQAQALDGGSIVPFTADRAEVR
jgi:hypothetical protein